MKLHVLLLVIVFSSCTVNRITTYQDPISSNVSKELRISLLRMQNMSFYQANSPNARSASILSPFLSYDKIIRASSNKIEVYALLNLHPNSYTLRDTGYIIIGDVKYPFILKDLRQRRSIQSSPEYGSVTAVDSSEVKVITGINSSQENSYRFHFELPYDIAKNMADAYGGTTRVRFVYYAGPAAFEAIVLTRDLRDIKGLISQQ